MNALAAKPWYREFWVWFLMFPPVASVLGGVTMVYLATSVPNALVVEDYARIDAITSLKFARDIRAADLGVRATADFSRSGDGRVTIALELEGLSAPTLPDALFLRLRHITLSDLDVRLRLERNGNDYRATTLLTPGRYLVEIEPPDGSWRLGASLRRVPSSFELSGQPVD